LSPCETHQPVAEDGGFREGLNPPYELSARADDFARQESHDDHHDYRL
jgi:hypothetical protein